MATGFMAADISRKAGCHSKLIAMTIALISPMSMAQEVGLAGIMGSKAMLMINGGEPQAGGFSRADNVDQLAAFLRRA